MGIWELLLLLVILGVVRIGTIYNKLAKEEEMVRAAWTKVEIQYQRRADIIPNIIATVKGYATHEKDVLEKITETRVKANQIVMDPANITPQQLSVFQSTQKELGQAITRVIAIAENYPALKANVNFLDLQTQLEMTENNIAMARNTYTHVVCTYNGKIRRFPSSIIAHILGFKKKAYFEADDSSRYSHRVSF